MKDDGSVRKIAVHAAIGGIMSQITGAGFASGAVGAGVNEAVIHEISKIKDPGTAQIVSSIVGAAAAKAAGGNAGAGAAAAASGMRNNFYLLDEVKNIMEEYYQEIVSEVKNEAIYLVENNYVTPGELDADYYIVNISIPIKVSNVGCIIDRYGNVYATVAFGIGASVGLPFSTGQGWLIGKESESSEGYKNIIAGTSGCVSAIGGIGGTLSITVDWSDFTATGAAELDSSISAGASCGVARTQYIGNVWNWINE